VRLLKVYLAPVTMALIGTISGTVAGAQDQRQRFTEIDVERINVIERDGRLRLVVCFTIHRPYNTPIRR
jgi:hypothetical protein